MPPTNKVVLDASALLTVLRREPGGLRVEPLLGRAVMSAVNLAEVASALSRRGLPSPMVFSDVCKIVGEVRPFDARQASLAVALDVKTRGIKLPFPGRACLALATSTGLPVLTAVETWAGLDVGVSIELVRGLQLVS